MEFAARILHSDGRITTTTISTPQLTGARLTSEGLMPACTALRKADPSVAAVKVSVPEYADYVWSGNYTEEHMAAIVARERSGADAW